jgi:hypothetical protein
VVKPTKEAARERSAHGLPYYSTILLIHDNESMLEAYSQKTVEKSGILFENFCKMPYIQLPLYKNVNGPNCYYFRSE